MCNETAQTGHATKDGDVMYMGGLEKDRASITDARQYVSFYLHMNINNQQG